MKNTSTKSSNEKPILVDRATDGCELDLSADQQWLRLIVGGKQVASFHVNYVNKILGTSEKANSTKRGPKETELPVDL